MRLNQELHDSYLNVLFSFNKKKNIDHIWTVSDIAKKYEAIFEK